MKLEPIIEALRQRCPILAGRVAGAAQFKLLPETGALQVPCAYVIPLDDAPGPQRSQNGIRQELQDSFAVVVALSNLPDEKGQGAANAYDDIRTQLFSALLGWPPQEEYEAIEYEGGSILALDRARMWCQFEFSSMTELDEYDGWQGPALAALPLFEGGTIKLDAIDPSDRNVVPTPAPDGRIEAGAVFPKTGNFPT